MPIKFALAGSNLLYLLEEHAGITAKIEPPEDWTDPVEDVEVDVPRVVSPSPVEGREQPPALREESRSRACSPGEPPG